MPRVIAQNRIPRVTLANRSIAVPAALAGAAGLGTGVGDITFSPVGFLLPAVTLPTDSMRTDTLGSSQVNVTQTAHGYVVGQLVWISGVTGVTNLPVVPFGQFTVASVVSANEWTYNALGTATQTIGFGGNASVIQPLLPASVPVSSVAVYQDALAQPAVPLKALDYPALFAMQGPISGKSAVKNAQTVATAVTGFTMRWSVVWKGQIYSAANTGALRKRATAMSPVPGADLIGAMTPASLTGLCATANYLVETSQSANALTLRTLSGNDVPTAQIAMGALWDASAVYVHTAFENNTGTLFALPTNPGPILRSTNGGAAWTAITSGLGTRTWTCMWRSGSTLYMLDKLQVLGTSNDDGVTWVVTTGLANVSGQIVCQQDSNRQAISMVVFDPITRLGYFINNSGGMRSFNMDNPTAGFTIDQADGSWGAPTGMRFANTAYGLLTYMQTNYQARPSFWARKRGVSGKFLQVCSNAFLPIDTGAFGACYSLAGSFMDLGDGYMTFDNSPDTVPTTLPISWQMGDLVNTFDRYSLPVDPFLPSLRRPFIRVQ